MSPKANLASSPPSLPVVRQPSPLSFSVTSDERSMPPSPTSLHASLADSSACSSTPPNLPDTLTNPSRPSRPLATRAFSSSSSSRHTDGPVPTAPLPDSILYRSTLTHLENSSTTLKRLSKSVLSHSSLLIAALEAVEKAEEEFLSVLGELGRYLESGFGVQGGLWADDGVRKVRKEKWVGQREEVRGMIEQGVAQVKGDLKRWGLAGGGSHARFERSTKQYYDQTSAYLSHSDPSAPVSHSVSATSSSTHSRQTSPTAVESEQSARTAAFDLARYSHHSTLLYAVPPSSISCLDLLVNIYSWVGGVLGENPTRKESIGGMDEAFGSTPSLILQTPKQKSSPSTAGNRLKDEVAQSLCKLAGIRVDLLDGWAKRDDQTTRLEDEANRLLIISENKAASGSTGSRTHDKPLSPTNPSSSAPTSSSAVEYKKNGRMHKLHKSVGGRLRDLLSSSGGSSRDLNGIVSSGRNGHLGGDRSNRNSFDVSVLTGRKEILRDDEGEAALSVPVIPASASSGPTIRVVSRPVTADPLPYRRPSLQSRHSIQITPDPNTPFLVDPDLFPLPALPPNKVSGPKTDRGMRRSSRSEEGTPVPSNGSKGDGRLVVDHEDSREEVGRKKEGVLWGAGTWEEVGKGGKVKWEKYWLVLDHSSIYEYRDTDFDKPEGAHAVIDLKFASVREGRGTDRRFVFEIVTPTQGRRLYQATSDSEMKQWIYSICNAIESVIQGTSSVRTFDTSKLRTLSGAYDDHAVPLRQKLGFPIPGIPSRSGLGGLPTIPGSPSRRSMPPPSRLEDPGPGQPRKRQTSFKKALRQSAEMAGEKWKDVLLSPRSPDGDGRQGFLAPQSGLRSSSSHSAISSAGSARYDSPPPPKSDGSHEMRTTRSRISDTGAKLEAGETSWWEVDADGEIEKRVMEMAGLGIGFSPNSSPNNVDRRVRSEGRGVLGSTVGGTRDVGEEMTRSKSAEVAPAAGKGRKLDMETLRWVAALPGNTVCADCGKSTKASRWATINLRETPMVMFICIRCCGIHRSFGTHISKPRSVDLDTWTQESISLALEWGNQRGNQIWEAVLSPRDESREGDMSEFVRLKYVEGKWLSDEMRARYGLEPRAGVAVGVALGEPGSRAITGLAR